MASYFSSPLHDTFKSKHNVYEERNGNHNNIRAKFLFAETGKVLQIKKHFDHIE